MQPWGYYLLYFYYISELQMNTENLHIVDGVEFASRSEAARHYGIEPKLVNERVTKFGWS